MKRHYRPLLLAVVAAAALGVLAATATAGHKASIPMPSKVTIAYQPGIGYAPLIMLKTQHTLEAQFPDTTFSWKVLSSGSAITNGMISGDVQIGAGGVGPLIVAWAAGVDLKIVAPLDWGDLWLMAKDPNIKTIADLKGKKIAMPGPTSIQGVVLRKMAQAKLGDAHALDAAIISMDHPTAMQALLTGQIDAHLTSAPYQLQEKVHGAHVVARSYQYFGAHSFLDAWETTGVLQPVSRVLEGVLHGRQPGDRPDQQEPDEGVEDPPGRLGRSADVAPVQAVDRLVRPQVHDAAPRADAVRELHEQDRDDQQDAGGVDGSRPAAGVRHQGQLALTQARQETCAGDAGARPLAHVDRGLVGRHGDRERGTDPRDRADVHVRGRRAAAGRDGDADRDRLDERGRRDRVRGVRDALVGERLRARALAGGVADDDRRDEHRADHDRGARPIRRRARLGRPPQRGRRGAGLPLLPLLLDTDCAV